MTGIKRYALGVIDELLKEFPVVILIGARQVGKTSLAKALRPGWRYFDLEKPSDFDRISQDPEFFFQQYSGDIVLDEAQEFPTLFKVLRGVIDSDREKNNRFLLTGSSSPALIEQVSESLAGRAALVEVGTLKATEFFEKPLSPFYLGLRKKIDAKYFENIKPQLTYEEIQKCWLRGGYPQPALKNRKDYWSTWMDNYFSTYLNRDIRKLFPKLDLVRFRRFITMLAKLSGHPVNKAQIAAAVEVSEPIIRDYLDIAEGTFLWRKLPSFESSAKKTVSKMPKGHLRDSGLLHYLLRISTLEGLLNDPIAGFSFESFVAEEILKGLSLSSVPNWGAYFYRTRNRSEVDLVLEGEFGVLPIEIKLGVRTPLKALQGLRNFVDENRCELGILINCSNSVTWLAPKILQLPVGCV